MTGAPNFGCTNLIHRQINFHLKNVFLDGLGDSPLASKEGIARPVWKGVHLAEVSTTRYARSVAMQVRAKTVLAGGVSSNFRYHPHPAPLVITHGKGAEAWDSDGNRYIDYIMGNGPAIHGYAHPAIVEATTRALEIGEGFASVSEPEVALGEAMVDVIPCAQRVRFEVSGTLADQIAIRLARAHTGRNAILKFEGHYHGWADTAFVSVRPPLNAAGPAERPAAVPGSQGQALTPSGDVIVSSFNDIAALERTFAEAGERIAAVILEPTSCNTGVIEPDPEFLASVRRLCDDHGALLIFDEVITGFRLSLGGGQEFFRVTPDLAVFAKAMGGGAPIAMVAGRADVMDRVMTGVVHGGTYNATGSALAAAAASLELLRADDGAAYPLLFERSRRLMDGLRDAADRHGLPLLVQGPGPVFCTVFSDQSAVRTYRDYKASDEALRLRFLEALQDRGIRTKTNGTWFPSLAHTPEDIDTTISAADDALAELARTV